VADHPTCLCIVSRDRLRGNDFIAALGASMRPDEQLEIIVDRRSGEPSNDWDPTQDRRRRPQVDLALKANGFAVVPAPSQGGRRTPTSLLVPSAPRSDVGFDGGYNGGNGGFDDGDDDEERLEAIRSFKRERSNNLVPWLIAALAVVAALAFILSPTGHALKQTISQRMSTDTTSSSSATSSSNPPATAPPSNPAPASQARAPVVADKPPAADAPARAPAPETPRVDRPLRGPASPPEPAPPREAARVDPSRDAGTPTLESNGSPGSSTAPGAARRSRAMETDRPSTSTPVPRQAAVAPPPSEPLSRSVSPRFAGLPRVELSREAGSSGGTYSARIVDPAGKPLPDAEVLLLARMPDGTVENVRMDFYPDLGTYRGSLPTTSSPVDIRVRVITGDKRVEIPLGP
jgi:hypothetical protein